MKFKSTIINLYGGPGIGKSSTAAHIFYLLKKKGYNAELTYEYAKLLTYENNFSKIQNQSYLFSKQLDQIFRTRNLVDYNIMDSPLLLSAIYDIDKSETFKEYIMYEYSKFNNINFYIERETDYKSEGRYHSYNEALLVDKEVLLFLNNNNIPYIKVGLDSGEQIVNYILSEKAKET